MSDYLAELEQLADRKNINVVVIDPDTPKYSNLEFSIATWGFRAQSLALKGVQVTDDGNEGLLIDFGCNINDVIGALARIQPHIIFYNSGRESTSVIQEFFNTIETHVQPKLRVPQVFMYDKSLEDDREALKSMLNSAHANMLIFYDITNLVTTLQSVPLPVARALGSFYSHFLIRHGKQEYLIKLALLTELAFKALSDCRQGTNPALFREIEIRLGACYKLFSDVPLETAVQKYFIS